MAPQEEEWSWARRIAQPWVKALAIGGWTGTDILDWLREYGWGYRMTDVYADIRRFTGRELWSEQVAGLTPGSLVPRSWMSEEPYETWHVGVPYKVAGYAELFNPETEESELKYVDIGLPREMTIEEIADYVFEEVPWAISKPELVLTGWQAIGMAHLQGAGY